MKWQNLISWVSALILLGLLITYFILFFFPYSIDFSFKEVNNNFSITAEGSTSMQFYPNMRFPTSTITYSIDKVGCTVKKIADMKRAFSSIQDQTSLSFIELPENGAITIVCESTTRVEEGLYIACEGGPSNVTQTGLFNVISKGNILLIREDRCQTPSIAIHELLHVLGFDHSTNKNNIMYPVTNCKQTIGQDALDLINELYKTPSYPDLAIQNASASFTGNYFTSNVQIINQGLSLANNSTLIIYGDDKEIKRVDIEELDYGYGRIISFERLLTSKRYDKVEYDIEYNGNEISKENNKAILIIKK